MVTYETLIYDFLERYGGLECIIELPIDCELYEHWGFIIQLYYYYNQQPVVKENKNKLKLSLNNMKDSFKLVYVKIADEMGYTENEALQLLKYE